MENPHLGPIRAEYRGRVTNHSSVFPPAEAGEERGEQCDEPPESAVPGQQRAPHLGQVGEGGGQPPWRGAVCRDLCWLLLDLYIGR